MARPLVDQLSARCGKPFELCADIVDLERDVMHARPALGEELAHRRVGPERGEQLDPSAAHLHRDGLDALVDDRLPVLELRPEQAAVGIDGFVEVVDRYPEVVNVPNGHGAMLAARSTARRLACEDRAVRLALSTVVLAGALVLGGCGSSGPKSNGVETKTADEILAAAQAAAAGATSVHVSGSGSQAGTTLDLNLYLAAGKGGKGHMDVNGLAFDIIRVGPTAYFKGDAKFWSNFGGGTVSELLKNRWLSEPSGTGDLASLSSLTDIRKLFGAILGSHGALTKGATSTVHGQSVIALNDPSKKAVLYVSTTGEPYPVELASTSGKGTITFGEWNAPVTLTAPAGSIDINKLKEANG